MEAKEVFFDEKFIYLLLENGQTRRQSLSHYPKLQGASSIDRMHYQFGSFGIHWEVLDEDVSYESFTYDGKLNEVSGISKPLSDINISQFAQRVGINATLMKKYIYGVKKPNRALKKKIETEIHELGRELLEVKL